MGKKKLRAKYTSKGTGSSVAKKNLVDRTPIEKHSDRWKAFLAGKRVFFTIANPNTKETNKPFVRVLGSDLYGDYRKYSELAKF